MNFAWTIVVLVIFLAISWRFLGSYMVSVYEGRVRWLALVERPIYRVIGVDPESEQSWQRYATSVILFSAAALLISYLIFRIQGHLPFNPQHLADVTPALSWNTAVSFVTNTNWQAYSGETTMSYLSQMGALAVQNFLSAAVGIAVAVALIRGLSRRGSQDDRQLLGRPGPRHHLRPAAHRVRGRHHLHRPGRPADPGRPGARARRPQRRAAGHPARPGRLPGGHQAAGHERRRVLQRQRREPVREPDRADQLPVDRAHPVHPGRRSPTPSARWSAACGRAWPSSP